MSWYTQQTLVLFLFIVNEPEKYSYHWNQSTRISGNKPTQVCDGTNITHSSACHVCAMAQPHEYKSTTQISSRDSFFIMIRSPSNWSNPSEKTPPSQDPAKSQSHETGILNCCITLKPDRHISSTAAEVPVKSQSDRTIPNTNPAAPRPYEIPRKDVPSDIETGPCILERSNGITAQIYIHPVIHVHHGWKMCTFLQSANPNPRKEALPDIQHHRYDT